MRAWRSLPRARASPRGSSIGPPMREADVASIELRWTQVRDCRSSTHYLQCGGSARSVTAPRTSSRIATRRSTCSTRSASSSAAVASVEAAATRCCASSRSPSARRAPSILVARSGVSGTLRSPARRSALRPRRRPVDRVERPTAHRGACVPLAAVDVTEDGERRRARDPVLAADGGAVLSRARSRRTRSADGARAAGRRRTCSDRADGRSPFTRRRSQARRPPSARRSAPRCTTRRSCAARWNGSSSCASCALRTICSSSCCPTPRVVAAGGARGRARRARRERRRRLLPARAPGCDRTGADRRCVGAWVSGSARHGARHERGGHSRAGRLRSGAIALRGCARVAGRRTGVHRHVPLALLRVIDEASGVLRFANAGHPHAFVLGADGHGERLAAHGAAAGLQRRPDRERRCRGARGPAGAVHRRRAMPNAHGDGSATLRWRPRVLRAKCRQNDIPSSESASCTARARCTSSRFAGTCAARTARRGERVHRRSPLIDDLAVVIVDRVGVASATSAPLGFGALDARRVTA